MVLPRVSLLMRGGRAVTGLLRELMEERREGRNVLPWVPRESGVPYVIT